MIWPTVVRRDLVRFGGEVGADQGVEAGGVRLEEDLQGGAVEVAAQAGGVGDGGLRAQPEGAGDVTELEVDVDDRHPTGCRQGESGGEVGGHRRLAGAALGGQHGDDPAPRRLFLGGGGAVAARLRAAAEPARVSASRTCSSSDAGGDDLPDARPQGPLPQSGGGLGDDHDAHLGVQEIEGLGQGDGDRRGQARPEDHDLRAGLDELADGAVRLAGGECGRPTGGRRRARRRRPA